LDSPAPEAAKVIMKTIAGNNFRFTNSEITKADRRTRTKKSHIVSGVMIRGKCVPNFVNLLANGKAERRFERTGDTNPRTP
jgi:hypothetical protein